MVLPVAIFGSEDFFFAGGNFESVVGDQLPSFGDTLVVGIDPLLVSFAFALEFVVAAGSLADGAFDLAE